MTQQMIAQCSACEAWVHRDHFMHGLGCCEDCYALARERSGIDDDYLYAMSKVLKGEWETMTGHPSYGKTGQDLWVAPSGRKRTSKYSR